MEFFSFDALRAPSKHVHSFAAQTELLKAPILKQQSHVPFEILQ